MNTKDKIARMKQPVSLRSEEYLPWHRGKGTDVWAMICATIAGDLDSIKALVAKDPGLVDCEFEYLTPIRFAAREGHQHIVEYLLEKGVTPETKYGDSLLTIARDHGHEKLIAFLESELKSRYHIVSEGETIASLIKAFDKKGIKEFFQKNPELIHAADARGNQPIHWAVLTRQLDIIDYLLQHGANINAMRTDGARPLDLTNGDYYYRSSYRDLPPTGLKKHEMLVGWLVARGADYDISVASKIGHYERVKELLEQDPSLANKLPAYYGYYSGPPLRCAAGAGYIEIVKLLLQYGADPNQPEPGIGPHGVALHAAISIRHLPIVKLLLEHGADPNGHVESSGNCLWMAKHVGAPQEMIDLLIARGARLDLELICYDGDAETLAQMLSANPQLPFNEDQHRVVLEKKQLVELILQYQPDILKRFCLRGFSDPELARWLISKGLDPDNGDWLGTRPLHSAATNGNIEMASVYLEAGADINIIDTDSSSTPMGWAARHGKKEMVEWLLQQGADPNLPEDEPWARPIAWAKRKGYEDIVALLNTRSKM